MAKASNEELTLHDLIKDKNDLALVKLYDLYGELIAGNLKRWYPDVAKKDDGLISEAVNEAFFGYHRNPGTFDPQKNTLRKFLEIAAERDLLNILAKEKKHNQKKNFLVNADTTNYIVDQLKDNSQAADATLLHKETSGLVDKELMRYFKKEKDRILAKMILQGESPLEVFAEILGLHDLSAEEKMIIVKRTKDRIKKTIDRKQIEMKLKRILS